MTDKKISKYTIHKSQPYFYHDRDDDFVYFKTEQERDLAVKVEIQNHLDDAWSDEVGNIVVGQLTGFSAMVDVEMQPDDLDEDGCDGEGTWWDSDWAYKCNYEIKPLGYVCPTTSLLKTKDQQ